MARTGWEKDSGTARRVGDPGLVLCAKRCLLLLWARRVTAPKAFDALLAFQPYTVYS